MFQRQQPPSPPPHDRSFIVNLADGTSLRINATSQMVTIYHHRKLHQEPIYRAVFFIADNPALGALYSARMGWDIVGLISLMRSEITGMAQLNLRDPELRQELGLKTVSKPSRNSVKQEKRPMGETLELIADFVTANPGCKRSDIARELGRAVTPTLVSRIEFLVAQKVLLREHVIRATGAVEYHYKIMDQDNL